MGREGTAKEAFAFLLRKYLSDLDDPVGDYLLTMLERQEKHIALEVVPPVTPAPKALPSGYPPLAECIEITRRYLAACREQKKPIVIADLTRATGSANPTIKKWIQKIEAGEL